jgi:hypothetical protein
MREFAEYGSGIPIRLLPPETLVTDDIHNLPLDLILPNIGILRVNQNISSTPHPDHIAKTRLEFD